MKNFTNNFKQFTSRLSARWLIIALMMLVGTSSAWAATIYFDNTNTKWSNVYIYLYDDTYWDYNNGSGANNIKACGTMTPIGNNIYSYTYSGNYNQVVSFTSQNQCGYNNFSGNSVKVCYSDSRSGNGSAKYTNSKPLFIPDTSSSFNKNNNTATYYHGDWATEPQIDIDPCAQKYYLKHASWSGSGWAWKELTSCNDGVYTLEATYNGSGCNYNTSANDNGAGWIANLNNPNNIKSGTLCIFTFDPSVPSITITPKCTTAEFSVSLTNNGTVNKGEANIKASVSGTPSPAVTWSSSDSNIATIDDNGNITAEKYGKVTITATTKGTDAYCSGTQQTAELTVRETPTITIEGNTTFCGESTTLTADISDLTATNTNGKTITWYKDGGASSVGTGATYNATATGIYTAKITGTYIKETTSAGFSVTKKATPTASNFTYEAPSNLTYSNSTKSAIVGWNGTQGGAITVKYSSTSNKYTAATPKDAGTYYVFVSTEANENYCAVTDLYINTFKIAPAEQTDFSVTNDDYSICGKSVTVTAAGGQSDGAITYSITEDNTSSKDASINPTTGVLTVKSAGTVSVQAKRAATTNYKEITDNVTFTFTMPIENVKLAVKSTSAKESYCKNDVITLVLTYDGPTPNYDAREFEWVLDGIQSGTEFIGGGSNGIKSGSEFQLKLAGIGVNKVGVKLKGCNDWVQSTDENSVNVTVNALPSAPGLKTASSIKVCPGNLTLANYVNVASGTTVLWFTDEDCTQSANSPSIVAGERKVFYAKAKNTSTGCLSAGKTTLTITAYSAPADFTLTAIPTEICSGADVVISISNKQDGVTYKLGDTEINESITVKPKNETSSPIEKKYTVTASLIACPTLINEKSASITVNPLPEITIDLQSFAICMGDGENVETGLTFLAIAKASEGSIPVWYDAEEGGNVVTNASLDKNATYYVAARNETTGCESDRLPFVVTVNKRPENPTLRESEYKVCEDASNTVNLSELAGVNDVRWYLGKTEVEKPDQVSLATAGIFVYTAKAVNDAGCVSADGVEFTLTVYAQPTFTVPAATQTNKEITLESAAGASTQWSVSPTENVTLTVNDDGTATFVATANGDYTITASNGVCAPVSHTIKVSDAFYIWVRNAKEGETAYANFYDPNQNTEDVQGGEMFYAECDALPTNGNTLLDTHFVNYNKGGRKADIITTDCDGYTWYGFKASAEVVAGTKYFYVHATNDKNYNGHFTHTVPTKKTLTSDVYYTLGTTNHVTTYYGWNIVLASAPYAGPKVHASGSTTLGTDKFAALYVTDCSGKEIDAYQWEYCRTEDGKYQPYSSVCSYTFEKKDVVKTETSDAGETNNIRPSELGYYRCKVTYKDGTTATSATEHILGSYSRSFTSNIPVLVVNTGSKGFPDCTGISGQTASLNASKFKAKRSVDVKIYEGETLVYDRKARMNYRGSSSLNFVKKSYAFCPGDANCEEKDGQADYVKTAKLNMLGVGTACDKDWVLYAAAADPSLMRNRLVFDSYKAMTGKWGVNSRYVELIVDGVYKGVYVFMDKITMNTERVKVDEDKGFIVKFDKTDREDRVGGLNGVIGDEKTFKTSYTGKDDIVTYDTSIDQRFEIEYPEKDDYTTGWKARVDGIQGMFQAFEDALKQGDYATVQKYIDYTSWADWFIINEFTKNVDAYRASCIFVYTGEAGAKIEARPLWDQELSFNNQASKGTSDKGSNSTTGLLIQHSNVYSDAFKAPFWFTGGGSDITGGLLSDPCFVQVVKERWNMHQSGALSKKSLEDLVDEYEDDLAPEGTTENAQTRETTFWDGKSRGKCDCSYEISNATATGYQNKTFEESKGTITNWISDDAASGAKGRRAGLTTAINGLTGASFSIQIIPSEAYTTPWEPVEIAVSVTPAGYDYKLEYTGDNNLGGVANTIIKEEGDKITYRIPRPSDWGAGDAEEGKRTDIEYGIKATLSVQEGTTVCGSQAAPSSTGKIILQDEDNDNCK